MKLNTNSNTYTVVYAAIVVVIVALLLALISTALKDRSDANVRIDTKKQILASLGQRNIANEEVEALYDKLIKADPVVDTQGNELEAGKDKDKNGFAVERKDIKAESNRLPVFVAEVDGQTKYVLPLVGKGLWGGIWGYLAINADGTTVCGAYFGHEGETAGLGAEIVSYEKFQKQFKSKQAYDAEGNAALSVVKNGQAGGDAHKCDGISGATLTGNGVNNMLAEMLKLYKPYLDRMTRK